MKTPDLKPCSVCKETKYLCYCKDLSFWHRWQIVCTKCDYYGSSAFSKRLAAWMWNRRVKDDRN